MFWFPAKFPQFLKEFSDAVLKGCFLPKPLIEQPLSFAFAGPAKAAVST